MEVVVIGRDYGERPLSMMGTTTTTATATTKRGWREEEKEEDSRLRLGFTT